MGASAQKPLPSDWLQKVVQAAAEEVDSWPEWKKPAGLRKRESRPMIDDAILRTALEARAGFDLCGCPEGECELCKGSGNEWPPTVHSDPALVAVYSPCHACNGAGRTREKCWESATCSCAQAMRQALEAVEPMMRKPRIVVRERVPFVIEDDTPPPAGG